MLVPALISMVSTGLLFFYLPVVCQRLLRRQSTQELYQGIVAANRLEFLSVRKALEDFESPVDYMHFTAMLKCDFLTLTYLVKNAANVNQCYTCEDFLLILYYKVLYISLVTRHLLRLNETSPALKMTTILQYFANVVGKRVNALRFEDRTASNYLTPSDYLLNI